MATYKKLVKWKRWHASPAELGSIARQATELLRADHDRSDQGYRTSITVALPGLETTFDSPADFEREVLPGDLPRIENIRVAADSPQEDRAVVLTVSRASPALSLDVRGTNRKEVEGIAEVLRDSLNRGRRVTEAFFTWSVILFGVFFLGGWFALIFLWNDAPWWISTLGAFAGFAWVIPTLILNRLVPTLELIPDGTKTRWDRSRRWLVRTVYGALAAAASAGLAAAAKAIFS